MKLEWKKNRYTAFGDIVRYDSSDILLNGEVIHFANISGVLNITNVKETVLVASAFENTEAAKKAAQDWVDNEIAKLKGGI